jgi:DNA-binding IclR family transcriptional regulator
LNKGAGSQPNKSLIDGIVVLQTLASSKVPVGTRELARQLSMENSRVNRILKTLSFLGMARQTRDRKYTSGSGLHVLASQTLFQSQQINRALEPLEKLHSYNLVVAMGVLWGENVSYFYHAEPKMDKVEALGRVGLYPATQSGLGISLLAALPDEEILNIYKDKKIPNFPDGIENLLSELTKTRKQGYSYIQSDSEMGYQTIAVTVGSPVHSAIGLSGKISKKEIPKLKNALISTTNEIDPN